MSVAAAPFPILLWCLLGAGTALLLIAAFRDVALRLLPNWTSAALALIGVALRLRDHSLPLGLLAALGVFAVTYVCWRRGWMGGGDVKLLAACALLVPPGAVPALVILTTLGGGLLALLYLALQCLLPRHSPAARAGARRWLPVRLWRVECRRIARRAPLPYGCVIAAAAIILLLGPDGPIGK